MLSCASADVLYETLAFRECIYLIYENVWVTELVTIRLKKTFRHQWRLNVLKNECRKLLGKSTGTIDIPINSFCGSLKSAWSTLSKAPLVNTLPCKIAGDPAADDVFASDRADIPDEMEDDLCTTGNDMGGYDIPVGFDGVEFGGLGGLDGLFASFTSVSFAWAYSSLTWGMSENWNYIWVVAVLKLVIVVRYSRTSDGIAKSFGSLLLERVILRRANVHLAYTRHQSHL